MSIRTHVPRLGQNAALTPMLLTFPGTDALAGAASSALATTANTLTLITGSDRGVTMDGTRVTGTVTVGGILVGAFLPVPISLFISVSANTGSVITIRGFNQFWEPITEIITMSQATACSRACYSKVDSIKMTLGTGSGAETVAVGWKLANTAAAFAALPLPFKLKAADHIVGGAAPAVYTLDAADSSLANIVKGTFASACVLDVNNSAVRIPSGAVTTQPTLPMTFSVILAQDAVKQY